MKPTKGLGSAEVTAQEEIPRLCTYYIEWWEEVGTIERALVQSFRQSDLLPLGYHTIQIPTQWPLICHGQSCYGLVCRACDGSVILRNLFSWRGWVWAVTEILKRGGIGFWLKSLVHFFMYIFLDIVFIFIFPFSGYIYLLFYELFYFIIASWGSLEVKFIVIKNQ